MPEAVIAAAARSPIGRARKGVCNVRGGAIALSHPHGMTGARITTTSLNGLRARDKSTGPEAMCAGGGQGMALILGRLA